jgi:hypothetical protein
MGNYT